MAGRLRRLFVVAALAGTLVLLGAGRGPAVADPRDDTTAPHESGAYILRLEDGSFLRLGPPVGCFTYCGPAAVWSPDSARAAFAESNGGLRVVERASGAATLVAHPEQGWAYHLAWSPDGSRLAFALTPPGGPNLFGLGLYVARAPAYRTAPLVFGSVGPLAWRPDGGAIAVGLDQGLILLDPESGERRETLVPLTGELCMGGFAWSPDGATLAFTTTAANPHCLTEETAGTGLWLWDAATGERRQLAQATDWYFPQWLPGGALLVKVDRTSPETLGWDLLRVGPDGAVSVLARDIVPTTTSLGLSQVAGETILFGHFSCERGEVYVVDAVGGPPRLLSDPSHYAISPVLSADGQRVLYVENREAGVDLIEVAVDGRERRVLLQAPGLILADWSPDGRAVSVSLFDQPVRDCSRGLP